MFITSNIHVGIPMVPAVIPLVARVSVSQREAIRQGIPKMSKPTRVIEVQRKEKKRSLKPHVIAPKSKPVNAKLTQKQVAAIVAGGLVAAYTLM